MNLWLIFLTGLTTGGLSCLAVQGGLLAGIITNQKQQELDEKSQDKSRQKQHRRQQYLSKLTSQPAPISSLDSLDLLPVGMFLLAKLIAHTILGFLLGSLGSVLELSLTVRLVFQVFTALFMAASAANLLNLHPIFRYLAFTPPRFVRRMVKNTGRSRALFAPFILGLMTIFIPCGVTQAMEVLVISTGSPVLGALTMFVFVLGTMPLFALIGLATAKLTESWYQVFTKVAAIILIVMSLYSLNGVLLVLDSPISTQKFIQMYQRLRQYEQGGRPVYLTKVVDGVQQVKINVTSKGYTPDYFQVKAGMPVELTIETNDVYTCASAFTFRAFDIYANLKSTDQKTFTLTPDKKGKFNFACSMGMYTGVMEVI